MGYPPTISPRGDDWGEGSGASCLVEVVLAGARRHPAVMCRSVRGRVSLAAAALFVAAACRHAPEAATSAPAKAADTGPPAPSAASGPAPSAPAVSAASATADTGDPDPDTSWIPAEWHGPDGPLWGGAAVGPLLLTRAGALQRKGLRFVDLATGALGPEPKVPWPFPPYRDPFVFDDGVVHAELGGALALADPSTRADRWRIQLAAGEGIPPGTWDVWELPWQWARVGATLVAIDHARYNTRRSDRAIRARGFRVTTGARAWDLEIADAQHDALLAGSCDGVFLVDVTPSLGHPGDLVAFDAATGVERWRRDGVIDVRPGELEARCSRGRVLATTGHDVRLLVLECELDGQRGSLPDSIVHLISAFFDDSERHCQPDFSRVD